MAEKPKRPTITLQEMDADRKLAIELAKQPGGVDVVDETGKRLFSMSIPGPMKLCPTCKQPIKS